MAYGKLGSELTVSHFHQNTTIAFSDLNATLHLEASEEKAMLYKEMLLKIKEK